MACLTPVTSNNTKLAHMEGDKLPRLSYGVVASKENSPSLFKVNGVCKI